MINNTKISSRIIFIDNIKNFDIDKNKAELVVIDCKECQTKQELFDIFKEKLYFPDYFGNNWDAFDDSLYDLGGFNTKINKFIVYIYLKNLALILPKNDNDRKIFLEIINQDYKIPQGKEKMWMDIYFLVDKKDENIFENIPLHNII